MLRLPTHKLDALLMAANKKLMYDPTRDADGSMPGTELVRAA